MNTEAIAESITPIFQEDTRKTKYLSFRASGFGVREAAELVGVHQTTIKNWRKADPEFERQDLTALKEIRKQFSADYLDLEFTRNYRLILKKDFDIILKSIQHPNGLDTQEHQYLLKARAHYTPQQLTLIKQLVGEVDGSTSTWQEIILKISRTHEEIEVRPAGSIDV